MRVTDLMVMDWFKAVDYNAPFRITAIYDDVVQTQADYQSEIDGNWYSEAEIKDLVPIPLTEEILVKNGFHTYGESYFIPEDECIAHVRIGFHYRETVVDLHRHGAFSIQISYKPGMLYVHTLQHLLRERGIDKEIEL